MKIQDALNDPPITVVARDDDRGLYRFTLGSLRTIVTIQLYPRENGWADFSCSHAIKTPEQAGPYHGSRRYGESPGLALHQAISGLTQFYRIGVEAGHSPREDWL